MKKVKVEIFEEEAYPFYTMSKVEAEEDYSGWGYWVEIDEELWNKWEQAEKEYYKYKNAILHELGERMRGEKE